MIAENQSLENFQEVIKGKKIVLFGAGFLAMKFINNCLENSRQVAYICDNNTAKHGKKLLGIDIVSPNALEMENKSNTIIVLCTAKYNPLIAEQICKSGYGEIIMFAAYTVMSSLHSNAKNDQAFNETATYFATHKKDFLEIQNYFSDDYSKNIWHKIREKHIYGIARFSDITTVGITYLPEILFADALSDNEIVISAGVFDGCDTKNFCDFFGKRLAKLYAFELSEENYKKSKENLYEYYAKNKPINLINCGLSDKEQKVEIISGGGDSGILTVKNSYKTHKEYYSKHIKSIALVRPLDSIIPSDEKVTYIKMDIEGSEIKALLGAKRIIQEHKPRLAICVYHNPEDYFEIPRLLKQFVPEYKFYLRHHNPNRRYDTVLYAAVVKNPIISDYNHIFQASNSFGGALISGWSQIETWGCWSEGNTAQLAFLLFEKKEVLINLKCHGFLRPTYITIDINEVKIGEYTVEDVSDIVIPIKMDYLKEKDEAFPVVIQFNIKNPAMPGGDDTRMLGIGLHSFYLSPVE